MPYGSSTFAIYLQVLSNPVRRSLACLQLLERAFTPWVSALSACQRDVLAHIMAGQSNKTIAFDLV